MFFLLFFRNAINAVRDFIAKKQGIAQVPDDLYLLIRHFHSLAHSLMSIINFMFKKSEKEKR